MGDSAVQEVGYLGYIRWLVYEGGWTECFSCKVLALEIAGGLECRRCGRKLMYPTHTTADEPDVQPIAQPKATTDDE